MDESLIKKKITGSYFKLHLTDKTVCESLRNSESPCLSFRELQPKLRNSFVFLLAVSAFTRKFNAIEKRIHLLLDPPPGVCLGKRG